MTVETMNVHEALTELKMLEKRIPAETRAVVWAIANKHANTVVNGVKLTEVTDRIKSQYQKVRDLIRRRDAIKRAVVQSNAVTKINVAGAEYTVAEAIDLKNHGMEFLGNLQERMVDDYRRAERSAQVENANLESRADAYMKTMIGNSDTKNMSAENRATRDAFIAAQTMELIDPIGVLTVAAELDEQIGVFMSKVDSALSTSNALTTITVEY